MNVLHAGTLGKQHQSLRSEPNFMQIEFFKDIAAFHRLEERYTQALATDVRSSESWKRDIRRTIRSDGFDSPSDGATVNGAMARISEIE